MVNDLYSKHNEYIKGIQKQIITCPLNSVLVVNNGQITLQMIETLEIEKNQNPLLVFQGGKADLELLNMVIASAQNMKAFIQCQSALFDFVKSEYTTSFVSMGMIVDYCDNYIKLLDEEANNGSISLQRFKTIFNNCIVKLIAVITDYMFSGFCQEKEAVILAQIAKIIKEHLYEIGVYTPTREDYFQVDFNYYSVDVTAPTKDKALNERIKEIRTPAYLIGDNELKTGSVSCFVFKNGD